MAVGEEAEAAEALIPRFKFEKLLNQGKTALRKLCEGIDDLIDTDQAGRRISLLGSIEDKPAILIAEKAPFTIDQTHLETLSSSFGNVKNLGANDIYYWFLADSSTISNSSLAEATVAPHDYKLNLIYPCTEKHIKKYSQQGLRVVTETPSIYLNHVRPYMQKQRDEGRLNWVFNILEGRAEQEDVMYREHGIEGFVVAPDLNWDRKTLTSLHVLGIVERRDIWSVRDLTKDHVEWLRHMRTKFLDATAKLYPDVERDQLKLYVHYQPTYYHFHVHIVHVMLEAGGTQAVGKALGLENVISTLENLAEGKGVADLEITYQVGEFSEVWTEIFEPLKAKSEL